MLVCWCCKPCDQVEYRPVCHINHLLPIQLQYASHPSITQSHHKPLTTNKHSVKPSHHTRVYLCQTKPGDLCDHSPTNHVRSNSLHIKTPCMCIFYLCSRSQYKRQPIKDNSLNFSIRITEYVRLQLVHLLILLERLFPLSCSEVNSRNYLQRVVCRLNDLAVVLLC